MLFDRREGGEGVEFGVGGDPCSSTLVSLLFLLCGIGNVARRLILRPLDPSIHLSSIHLSSIHDLWILDQTEPYAYTHAYISEATKPINEKATTHLQYILPNLRYLGEELQCEYRAHDAETPGCDGTIC